MPNIPSPEGWGWSNDPISVVWMTLPEAARATDKSNQEQLTVVIRWVSDSFEVSEEFLGLHHMQSIDALSIVNVIKIFC